MDLDRALADEEFLADLHIAQPLGNLKIIPDFLPPPEDLIFKDERVKVTIALRKQLRIFQRSRAETQYQRMIRRLLDAYAATIREVSPGPQNDVQNGTDFSWKRKLR